MEIVERDVVEVPEAQVDLDLRSIEISHPVYKNFVVTVVEIDPVEKLAHFSNLQQYVEPVVLTHPGTHKLLFDPETNKPYVWERRNVPVSEMVKFLVKAIKTWRGLKDRDGNQIPYKPENIRFIFKDKFDYEEANPDAGKDIEVNGIKKVDSDGNVMKHPATLKKTFWNKLSDVAMEEKEFETDPLHNGSSTQ